MELFYITVVCVREEYTTGMAKRSLPPNNVFTRACLFVDVSK